MIGFTGYRSGSFDNTFINLIFYSMKQNVQIGTRSNPAPYAAPELAVSSITVEQGFAESTFDFSGDGIQDFTDSGSEWDW